MGFDVQVLDDIVLVTVLQRALRQSLQRHGDGFVNHQCDGLVPRRGTGALSPSLSLARWVGMWVVECARSDLWPWRDNCGSCWVRYVRRSDLGCVTAGPESAARRTAARALAARGRHLKPHQDNCGTLTGRTCASFRWDSLRTASLERAARWACGYTGQICVKTRCRRASRFLRASCQETEQRTSGDAQYEVADALVFTVPQCGERTGS